jgi:hypothetical protein
MRRLAVTTASLTLALTACSARAVTPNARAFAFDSPTTPEVGAADVQADLATTGAVFGPSAVNGGLRYRKTLRPGLVGEGEGGILHLTNDGSGGDRNAYTGRVGVMVQPSVAEEVRTALTLGVGGGLSSTAGNWASVDAGAAIGGSYRWVRPFVGGDLSYNASIGDRQFTIHHGEGTDASMHTLRLPDTVSLRGTAGLELGRPEAAVVIGFSAAKMMAREPDVVGPLRSGEPELNDEQVFAVGIGLRLALDHAGAAK